MVKQCVNKYIEDDKYNCHFQCFPFELSDFQKYAIEGIVDDKHVLVTAHTGSGKTLPAEFAIDYFVTKKHKKVIYTSPIKALSNQKFYEFGKKFPHIDFGILTGDIKFNPEADVLIMTTEILQNNLFQKYVQKNKQQTIFNTDTYNTCNDNNVNNEVHNNNNNNTLSDFNMDIENDLACVIFDEVHYINDEDRGKVWEQTIMMLPNHVQMVMLSATIDKPERFAAWCENQQTSTKNNNDNNNENKLAVKEVYLIPTNHRVVPLYHHLYLDCNQTLFKSLKNKELKDKVRAFIRKPHLLKDQQHKFNDNIYYETKKMRDLFDKEKCFIRPNFIFNNLASYLKNNDMLPAICFVFSRKNVEKYAHEVTTNLLEDDSKVPYIIERETQNILRKMPNYDEIINLPEYKSLIVLLQKGVAIHHSGILPVLREVVELLFAQGYIKLLFATETFAVGLNMPTKTVIFTSLYKYTSSGERYLYSHEYTQMAGRAGRRGIDSEGHVIHLCNMFHNHFPNYISYNNIVGGVPQTLKSKFKMNYALTIQLLKAFDDGNILHNSENFVKSSMMYETLQKRIGASEEELNDIQRLQTVPTVDTVVHTVDTLHTVQNIEPDKNNMMTISQEQSELCKQYEDLLQELEITSGNKKKKLYKKQTTMLEQLKLKIPNFNDSLLKTLLQPQKQETEIQQQHLDKQQEINSMKTFVESKFSVILNVLRQEDIVDNKKDNENKLTLKGHICSYLNEINPLLMGTLINEDLTLKFIQEISLDEFIGFLSCFYNVKVNESYRTYNIENCKHKSLGLQKLVKFIHETQSKYVAYETRNRFVTGEFSEELVFDLVDYVIEWCRATDEHSCQNILNRLAVEKELFVGDFSKALLKIYNIINELTSVYNYLQNVEMLHYLQNSSEKLLKYVVTNQSLYI